MFGPPGAAGTQENISSSPNWGEYDSQISKLLEDVPRATSAPPHLQDRWTPGPPDPASSSRAWPGIENSDIRYDEDYARFYEVFSGQRKLPPPVEGRTLYSELGLLQQQQKQMLAHQQGLLTSATPPPSQAALLGMGGALTPGGLEVIQEQGPNSNLVHAFHQLSVRGSSPAPRLGNGELAALAQQMGSKPGTPFEAALQALGAPSPAALAGHPALGGQHAPTPPPQLQHPGMAAMNGLTGASPPPSAAAAAAAAAALQQHQLAAAGLNPLLAGQTPEYMAAYTAAYQAALMSSQPNMLQAPGVNPQLAALQAAQAAALGAFVPPAMPNLQQQMLAAAMQQQLAGMQAPYNYHPGSAAAAAAAAAAAGAAAAAAANSRGMHMGGPGPGLGGGGGRGDGSHGGGFDRDEQQGRGEHKQRGGKGGKEGRDSRSGPGGGGGGGAGRRGERDKDGAASNEEGIAHFQARFQNLEDVGGQLMSIAQDQNGCRFLQRKFDEGGAAAIAAVSAELLEHATELMMDPFGNYLVQKLLERCSEEQRLEVLKRVCDKGEIIEVALNTHGTRAVQKLIETLTSREQKALVISALGPGVVSLIKDLNGNHVVQRCLQRLGAEDSQFIYQAAGKHCVEIASHRHGCCVLQRCIDFASAQQRTELVAEIAKHALHLSQDAFGNYVVQYVLELGHAESSRAIMNMLVGHYAELSTQKFSSNVVEKCLKSGGLDPERHVIIREVLSSPLLPRLLQDSYGNYVVQSALAISSGQLHQDLVDAIKPFLPSLRGTPHGKRILQKINGKV